MLVAASNTKTIKIHHIFRDPSTIWRGVSPQPKYEHYPKHQPRFWLYEVQIHPHKPPILKELQRQQIPPKRRKEKKKNFDSPRLLMPSLSIFNSPLRYFLHPSKAAVIINESLPVLSALCMRALRLKAEGNGGWTEGEGLWVTHANTHTASQGHWPTPKKPKILIAPSPISLNLDIVLLTQMGTKIRQSVEVVCHLQSQWA